jgi:hypothetical protein
MTYILDLHPEQRFDHHDARRLLPQPPVVCPQPVPLLQQVVEQDLVRCLLRRKVGLPINYQLLGQMLLLPFHGYYVIRYSYRDVLKYRTRKTLEIVSSKQLAVQSLLKRVHRFLLRAILRGNTRIGRRTGRPAQLTSL